MCKCGSFRRGRVSCPIAKVTDRRAPPESLAVLRTAKDSGGAFESELC
jgi:hypothetical protein